MSNFRRIGLFGIVAFTICVGGYFLLEKDEWIIAKKQINQLIEFDYDGINDNKPNRIEIMKLKTKFIENNDDKDLNLGFKLMVSIGEQEIKTIKTSFPEFLVKGRLAGYLDDQILDKLTIVSTDFKNRVNLARAYKYSDQQVATYLNRFGSVLKVVEEIIGYHVDLNICLLDKDGFCLKTLSYQTEKSDIFDNPNKKQDSIDLTNIIVPGKGEKIIQKTIQAPITKQLAKKVKSVTFWPVIRAETKLVDVGIDEAELKRLQEEEEAKELEEREKENFNEDNHEENSG